MFIYIYMFIMFLGCCEHSNVMRILSVSLPLYRNAQLLKGGTLSAAAISPLDMALDMLKARETVDFVAE